MDTTETTTPAQDTEAIDLPAPYVSVTWHLNTAGLSSADWRAVVRTITDALNAQWVANHSGSSHWLETTVPTRVGPLTIFVPEDDPRPVQNPDLSEFTVAGRARASLA